LTSCRRVEVRSVGRSQGQVPEFCLADLVLLHEFAEGGVGEVVARVENCSAVGGQEVEASRSLVVPFDVGRSFRAAAASASFL